ncbi:chaperone modulator CbpM [Ascidiimonas aurantiaca]|uniref:chaperone modulator CbpM n=1 Tax=Ascidiimonas aurantiaca TaxID=1685432 RepID=UPI0030EF2F3F
MKAEEYIKLTEFCQTYSIDYTFVEALEESCLIRFTTIHSERCVFNKDLPLLERLTRIHKELGVNFEGVETIYYMLNRMEEMQQEILRLQNRISRLE